MTTTAYLTPIRQHLPCYCSPGLGFAPPVFTQRDPRYHRPGQRQRGGGAPSDSTAMYMLHAVDMPPNAIVTVVLYEHYNTARVPQHI
eukprot:scaffold494223_cov19-Prasinocladus_malaysianus.AAC.1